jgi:DNA-binding PadR family transcriptional regulator
MMEKDIIIEILDHIHNTAPRKGVYTTYDQGLAECVKQEIIDSIKTHYDVEYVVLPKGVRIFPVKGGVS